jgi:hypothetical protein
MKLVAESDRKKQSHRENPCPDPIWGTPTERPTQENTENEIFQNVSCLSADGVAQHQLLRRKEGQQELQGGDNEPGSSRGGEGIC